MITLWEATKGFHPVSLDDFVPPSVAPGAEVIHHGKNSLPTFTHFQKRFSKPRDPESRRLGRFAYYGMIDVMRGISSHVTIGRARKKHGWMDAWFVLVREDPQPVPTPAS